jgi:hypothetical protein
MVTARYHPILVIVVISPAVSVTVIDLGGMDTVGVKKIESETAIAIAIVTALEIAVIVIKIGSRIYGIATGTRSEIAVKTGTVSESEIANVVAEGNGNGNAIVVVTVVPIVRGSASVVATDLNRLTPTPTIAPPSLKLVA